jgi:rhodanese-related sulfurtransferase
MFFFNRNQINAAVEEWRSMADAVLIDVREADEFRTGHIPGAINVPLTGIDSIRIPKDKQVFVYCLRGTRSSQAARKMKKMGFTKVKSIGGVMGYKGRIEK